MSSLSLSRRHLLLGGAALTGATLLTASPLNQATAEAAGQGRRFVAFFVFPQSTVQGNIKLFNEMRTDAISFAGRLRKPTPDDGIPRAISKFANGRPIYFYDQPLIWKAGQGSDHKWVWANHTRTGKQYAWDIVSAGRGVVISRNSGNDDKQHNLNIAANQLKYKSFIGIPALPQSSRNRWLPDSSYLDVYRAFVEKYVRNYKSTGADGWYHTQEITMSKNVAAWQAAWDTYSAANKAIRAAAGAGAVAIFSPYLEARLSKKGNHTPWDAVQNAKKFLSISHGLNVIISPQDGLGTGSTAFGVDLKTGYRATTEQYFKALQGVLGNKLFATTECMTPGGGTPDTRGRTSKKRVSQQLWIVGQYVQGHIGYMWNKSGIGARYIPGLGSSFSAGSGHLP